MPKIDQETVGATAIPVPPIVEQHRIVAEVERLLSVADEVEQTVCAQLARAQRLRQSVLKSAFEGKLVPQDPNDEPASSLLERIRKNQVTDEIKKPRHRSARRRSSDTEVDP
jgi:type I restriction enzyme S subunit